MQDYLNENVKNKAKQELLDHGYCLGFEWKDILKIGCKKEKKKEIFRVIQESFGIGETDALMKIEDIQTIDLNTRTILNPKNPTNKPRNTPVNK